MSHCTKTDCPIQHQIMSYCSTNSEIDPPCGEMDNDELESLDIEISNNFEMEMERRHGI